MPDRASCSFTIQFWRAKACGSGHWRVERDVLEGYIAGKYEENRRRNLWNQADYAEGPELFADRER